MKYLIAFLLFISFVSRAQILNAYAKVTNINGAKTTLTVTNVNQTSHTFTVGGEVIVMQMQDNVIGTNTTNIASFGDLGSIGNAGNYEIRTISARSPAAGTPTTITLSGSLSNTFNTGANSSVQIITLRNLGANYTTTATITGLVWDGNVGGVIGIQVTNTLTLNNSISANGIGFLGGTKNPNGYTACESTTYRTAIATRYSGKGEGIYKNTTPAYTGARGKILNGGGGGNDVNSGGGGGGNYSAGGSGGLGWVPAGTGCSPSVGGLGGISLNAQISASRLFMGGGGGAGHQNDGNGTEGGKGGGIILIKAANIRTTGACAISISANGANAANGSNDGGGGAGAGGSIVLQVNSYSIAGTCPLTVASSGGNGGASVTTGVHGGGGGGGQGVVIYSVAQPTTNITTNTAPGTGGVSCSGCAAATNGAAGPGGSNLGIINSSAGPLPIELVSFTALSSAGIVELHWKTATEINNDFFTVEKSSDGVQFEVIGTMKANNTITTSNYQLNDIKPYRGTNYYRLKQTDFDASYSYSNIIAVDFYDKIEFSVFPNPLLKHQSLVIAFDKPYETAIHINIYDVTGKIVLEKVIDISAQTELKLDGIDLPAGIYSVRLNNDYINSTQKIIIE
jgi:Secretion system C-terminal sorting domain